MEDNSGGSSISECTPEADRKDLKTTKDNINRHMA